MPKNRLQQFIDLHSQAASNSNGFAHEIHLSFVELGRILESEFDHKKDKMKTDIEKLFESKIPSQKELLYIKYPNCAICGKKFNTISEATKDHIKPKAKGGKNDITNFQLLCGPCNSRKGDFYDPINPNAIIYKKSKANVRFMLEESNYIEDITSANAVDEAYIVWNYLWTFNELTPKTIKKAHFKLFQDSDVEAQFKGNWRNMPATIGEITKTQTPTVIESQITDWCEDIKEHKIFQEIKLDHVRFEYIHPFVQGNGRLGRILMNWQLAKAGLPLCIILSKDKEEYYKWFEGVI